MSVIKSSQMDFSNVTFSEVRKMGKGKMVYANLNGGKIILQTPKMGVPFGVSRWRDDNADDNKGDSFRLGLSFYGEETNSELKQFKEQLQSFDEIIKNEIKKNSKEWLGKPNLSTELIEEAFYVSNVKIPKDSDGNVLEYPARFEVKLDRQKSGDDFTGKFVSNKKFNHEVLIYDENRKLVPMDESNYDTVIPKGSQCITIVELVYISITAKVSCKWKLVQAKVFKNQKAITEYAIVDEDESDEENGNSVSGLKDDLDSEPTEVPETTELADDDSVIEDKSVNDITEDLQGTVLNEEQADKPTKRGRKTK
jgi:hypothetical protein